MLPLNFKTIFQRMSAKTGLCEVHKGKVYFHTGRTVSSMSDISNYKDGRYKLGQAEALSGEQVIVPHFNKLSACDKKRTIPLYILQQIYKHLSAWYSGHPGELKGFKPDVDFSICRNELNKQHTIIRLNIDAQDFNPNLILSWLLNEPDFDDDVAFKLKVTDLMDVCFLASQLSEKDAKHKRVIFSYTTDENHLVNDLPFFIEIDYYDHAIVIGHQVVPALAEGEKADDPNSFLNKEGQVKEELETDEDDDSDPKVVNIKQGVDKQPKAKSSKKVKD